LRRRTEAAISLIIVVVAIAALFAYFNYGSGIIDIKVSDAPKDWGEATQIYLNYSSIEIHKAQPDNESGWFTLVEKSGWINLTRILDVNETLGENNLQTGTYNLIRFEILQANVTVAGINYAATVPSGKITIAITKGGIQINAGHTSTLLLEISVSVEGSEETGNFRIVPAVTAKSV
jgi:hypothetical protein